MSVVENLRKNVNSILGLRDSIGAALKPVFIVTRTWSGVEPGDGTAVDTKVQMLPSPRVVEYRKDRENKEGGSVHQADIMLKMVSKQTYDEFAKVDDSTSSPKIEKLYEVGGVLYRPIQIIEKHVVYNITLRQMSDQRRY